MANEEPVFLQRAVDSPDTNNNISFVIIDFYHVKTMEKLPMNLISDLHHVISVCLFAWRKDGEELKMRPKTCAMS